MPTISPEHKTTGAKPDSPGHSASIGNTDGTSRVELLKSVREAERAAAERRAVAEREAAEIRAEGRRAALKIEEDAEKEGRAFYADQLDKTTSEMGMERKKRLEKVSFESEAVKTAARSKFAQLGGKLIKELEGGVDAPD